MKTKLLMMLLVASLLTVTFIPSVSADETETTNNDSCTYAAIDISNIPPVTTDPDGCYRAACIQLIIIGLGLGWQAAQAVCNNPEVAILLIFPLALVFGTAPLHTLLCTLSGEYDPNPSFIDCIAAFRENYLES